MSLPNLESDKIVFRAIFAVKDLKADSLCMFFSDVNVHSAIRGFAHMLTGERSPMSEFPADFALVHLGHVYIDGTGVFFDRPVQVALASDYVKGGDK